MKILNGTSDTSNIVLADALETKRKQKAVLRPRLCLTMALMDTSPGDEKDPVASTTDGSEQVSPSSKHSEN
jgi:hypothetical protein